MDKIIPPEIFNDRFYSTIQKLASEEDVKTVLEIGSSSGTGSTHALVTGLEQNPRKSTLFCLEISKNRFMDLKNRYAKTPFVKCYNASSVSINDFLSVEQVGEFYDSTHTNLNKHRIITVLRWLRDDVEYQRSSGVQENGIRIIKSENDVREFDMVLIDGSAFTARAELEEVYGARLILLDDINDIKNFANYERLKADHQYALLIEDWKLRNGFAVFRKNDDELQQKSHGESGTERKLGNQSRADNIANRRTEEVFGRPWSRRNPNGPEAGLSKRKCCVFVNTYYVKFIHDHYKKKPVLASKSYDEQKRSLQDEAFGDCDFYSEGLRTEGWRAEDLIINCQPLQNTWAREHSFSGENLAIIVEQVRCIRPDVIYLQDLSIGSRGFLGAIRPYTDLVVGQIASPVPAQTHIEGFDIIFSSFPHFVRRFRERGIASYYQALAFDPRVLERIGESQRLYPVTFVGGISRLHGKGTEIVERLAEEISMDFWGYGAESLDQDSPIRKRHHGEVWGLEMFSVLGQSKITINRHIDVAEDCANNMRMFEATGCGALLVTDYKDNLSELFEIGKEIVAYRSPEECVALVKYYQENREEAQTIAEAGQKRTLRDHIYTKRMQKTAEILERRLEETDKKYCLGIPDMSKVSFGYSPIDKEDISGDLTRAWKHSEIPRKQRALVKKELAKMYQGKVPVVYQIFADLLRPYVSEGCSILEIGCASAYYYEILEYLLNKTIVYTGVDYSEGLISMGKDYYPNAEFVVADGGCLPFDDAEFFVAISSSILLHTPDYQKHIAETARVAEELVVAHRMPVCRERPTQYFTKKAYEVETAELWFNENEILSEFMSNGLKLIGANQYHSDPRQDLHELTYIFRKTKPIKELC